MEKLDCYGQKLIKLDACLISQCPRMGYRSGFLNICTLDIWGQIILCSGGCPVLLTRCQKKPIPASRDNQNVSKSLQMSL